MKQPSSGGTDRPYHLGEEHRRPHNGTCDKLREEGHERRVVHQRIARTELSLEYVDRIAHRLERVEADPCGEHNVQARQVKVAWQDATNIGQEEIRVLEVRENRKVRYDTEYQVAFSCGR